MDKTDRCRQCSGKIIHTTDRVRELLAGFDNGEYELLSESKNNWTLIQVKHIVCGTEYETTSRELLYNNDICPSCHPKERSIGEQKIDRWLIDNGYDFETEKIIDGCKHEKHLRFDFIIYKEDRSVLLVIEFDGKQHYEPVGFFGGDDGFALTRVRDGIKDSFCEKNGIPLLRIPYFKEKDIPKILKVNVKNLTKGVRN